MTTTVKLWHMLTAANLKTLSNPASLAIIEIEAHEFTLLGAKNQPDFGEVFVEYQAERTLELKSFKEYLYQYRDVVISYERALEVMYTHLYDILDQPKFLLVRFEFKPRGGISSRLTRAKTHE